MVVQWITEIIDGGYGMLRCHGAKEGQRPGKLFLVPMAINKEAGHKKYRERLT
jgi:hypothetical protein